MAQFGESYWQSRAEALVRGMDPEFFYPVQPGDTNYPQELWDGEISEHYLELGEQNGYQKLTRNLLIQQKMQDLYWDDEPGDRAAVTEMWLNRDENYPDWFWRYHGVYA